MKRINKFLFNTIFVCALFLISVISVNAESVYYTNSKGVQMTQAQYDYLAEVYSDFRIDNMTQDQFNSNINLTNRTITDMYIIEEEARDSSNNLLLKNTLLLTPSEYTEYKENVKSRQPQTRTDMTTIVTTSEVKMSLITGIVYNPSANILKIVINTKWINGIPSVKSFDISAFLFSTTGTLQLSRMEAEGYQVSDAGSVTYGNEGGNSKWQANAYGTSMNIINGTKKSLELEVAVAYYFFGSGNLNVNATYQHATRDVTLAQSHTYHFSTDGCGGVVNFYNNVGNYYNSNPGVTTTRYFSAS